MKKIIMDQESYERFQQDIKELEDKINNKRQYKGKVAIFQGDNWHDNPTLYQTELEEKSLMVQLAEMKEKLKNIEIVEKNEDNAAVDIGDIVSIALHTGAPEPMIMTIKLVGYKADLNASIKEISKESPLGASIIGKNVGEKGSYTVGNKDFEVQILEINKQKQAEKTETDIKVKTKNNQS